MIRAEAMGPSAIFTGLQITVCDAAPPAQGASALLMPLHSNVCILLEPIFAAQLHKVGTNGAGTRMHSDIQSQSASPLPCLTCYLCLCTLPLPPTIA